MGNNYNAIPASVYASWPAINYVNPVRRTWLPAFCVTWQVASTLLLSGRFYLRARKQAGSFGLDDAMIFLGWLFSLVLTAATYLSAESYGLDRHTWDMQPSMYRGVALTGWIGQIMFVISSVCTKLSVLLFYRRMMRETLDRRWVYALWGAITFTACYGIALVVAMFCYCQPLDALWRSYEPGYDKAYKCFDGSALVLSSGVLGTVSDIYAVALPCFMLSFYNLDVPRRQKIALNLIFGMGLLVTGCGIARTYYLWKSNNTYDTSWTGFELFAWTTAECQLGIICACAPSLRAFFRRYLRDNIKKTFGSALGSITHYRSTSSKDACPDTNSNRRDTRSYIDLKDLESNLSGSTAPRPSMHDVQEPEPAWKGRQRREDEIIERLPTPRITSPEDYEKHALVRLSMLSKRSCPALNQASAAKTDEAADLRQKYREHST